MHRNARTPFGQLQSDTSTNPSGTSGDRAFLPLNDIGTSFSARRNLHFKHELNGISPRSAVVAIKAIISFFRF
jgi:hypothetical protein